MSKNNTAILMNRCFEGKMSLKEHLVTVIKLFKSNVKDIVILGILMNLPIAFLYVTGFFNIIGSLIAVFFNAMLMSAITLLISGKSQGEDLNWNKAFLKALKRPLLPIGAFLIQTVLINLVGGGFLGIFISSFLVINIQFAVLSGLDMFASTKASFVMVSKNVVDVILKNTILNFLVALPTTIIISLLTTTVGKTANPIFFGGTFLISGIFATISIVSSVVFFYNLPTVQQKK